MSMAEGVLDGCDRFAEPQFGLVFFCSHELPQARPAPALRTLLDEPHRPAVDAAADAPGAANYQRDRPGRTWGRDLILNLHLMRAAMPAERTFRALRRPGGADR